MSLTDSFGFIRARNRQSKLDVFRDCLMRNEVVALNEADSVVPVSIPVPIAVVFRAYSVYAEISLRIMVQSADNADNIEKGGFSVSGGLYFNRTIKLTVLN